MWLGRFGRATAISILLLAAGAPVIAQTDAPSSPQATASPEPALRRWFDLQTFTLYARYRFAENSLETTTSNQLQYKEAFRARVNADASKRYTLNLGYFTGSNFTSTWDDLGVGHGTSFDRKNHYLKQLYASAAPVRGLELQYGGLYLSRGEGDEFLTYDDDGFLVGERVTFRRPRSFYLDEITVTRGAIGPLGVPAIADRWKLLNHPNYTQVLGVKQFNHAAGASLEYNRLAGADLLRGAVTFRLGPGAPVDTLRYEAYWRVDAQPASGFGLWAERPITSHVRLQAGYVSVDQHYGGWNADRMQSGRRFFAMGTIQIWGPLSASLYATRALAESYTLPIHSRFDAVVSYDVLASLRKTHLF